MSILRKFAYGSLVLFLCTATFAQSSGWDITRMDTSVSACTDFYQFANGNWLKSTPIPAAFPSWGSWDVLVTRNREISRDLLDEAVKKTSAPKGSSQQMIGDYYATCMDEAAIDKAGVAPLKPYLDQIDKLKTAGDVQAQIAQFHRMSFIPVFQFFAFADENDSSITIANTYQGGLGLPNRDYYSNADEKSVALRAKYVAHIARIFELLGDAPARAKANADTVMKMETRLALASKKPAELREPQNYYNLMTVAEADKLMGGFSWETYAKNLGAPAFTKINIGQPAFFAEVGKMFKEVPVEDWKAYLRWDLTTSSAADLSKDFADANFDFFSKTLSGTTEQLPRWRRCTRNTDNRLGEALGEEYIKQNFTPEAKKRMDDLITNLFAAYRVRIEKVDWMTDTTRKQALAKLAAIKRKIGYPDKWRGYAGLKLDRNSYFENSLRISEFTTVRELQDIGKRPDPWRWGMSPPTVNASYNSNYNAITFPAGILQPPFFDFKADDALNYGSIGGVIGHELSHGFDDSGSRYDAEGNLKMWWTEGDRKLFEEKADCIVEQFNGYEVEKGLFQDGKNTLGENIGDLGGLTMAYDALQKSMQGKPRPALIDGFTPEQRFFLGWARVWAENQRAEAARLQAQSDEHPLGRFRANGPLSNMTEFSQAFGCKVGDAMVRQKQCKVW